MSSSFFLGVIAACALSVTASIARADALPPPPECPAGKVAYNRHGGGSCVDAKPSCRAPKVALPDGPGFSCAAPAPTNCPNGFRGETSLANGPRCVVAECVLAGCATGETCIDHPVCVEIKDGFEYGARAEERSLFAAPPMPRKIREVTGICPAPGEASPAGFSCDTCTPSKICVRGAFASAAHDADASAAAGPSDAALEASVVSAVTIASTASVSASAVAATSSTPASASDERTDPGPRGCGSCAVGGGGGRSLYALGFGAALATLFALRRRRKSDRRDASK